MIVNKERQGELFIFSQAILWGLFPVITILSYNTVSPLISLEISTVFAALFFAVVLTIRKKWYQVTDTSVLKDILFGCYILSFLFFRLTLYECGKCKHCCSYRSIF